MEIVESDQNCPVEEHIPQFAHNDLMENVSQASVSQDVSNVVNSDVSNRVCDESLNESLIEEESVIIDGMEMNEILMIEQTDITMNLIEASSELCYINAQSETNLLTPDDNNEHDRISSFELINAIDSISTIYIRDISEQNYILLSSSDVIICENNGDQFEGVSAPEQQILKVKNDSSGAVSQTNKTSSVENARLETMDEKEETQRNFEVHETNNEESGLEKVEDIQDVDSEKSQNHSEPGSCMIYGSKSENVQLLYSANLHSDQNVILPKELNIRNGDLASTAEHKKRRKIKISLIKNSGDSPDSLRNKSASKHGLTHSGSETPRCSSQRKRTQKVCNACNKQDKKKMGALRSPSSSLPAALNNSNSTTSLSKSNLSLHSPFRKGKGGKKASPCKEESPFEYCAPLSECNMEIVESDNQCPVEEHIPEFAQKDTMVNSSQAPVSQEVSNDINSEVHITVCDESLDESVSEKSTDIYTLDARNEHESVRIVPENVNPLHMKLNEAANENMVTENTVVESSSEMGKDNHKENITETVNHIEVIIIPTEKSASSFVDKDDSSDKDVSVEKGNMDKMSRQDISSKNTSLPDDNSLRDETSAMDTNTNIEVDTASPVTFMPLYQRPRAVSASKDSAPLEPLDEKQERPHAVSASNVSSSHLNSIVLIKKLPFTYDAPKIKDSAPLEPLDEKQERPHAVSASNVSSSHMNSIVLIKKLPFTYDAPKIKDSAPLEPLDEKQGRPHAVSASNVSSSHLNSIVLIRKLPYTYDALKIKGRKKKRVPSAGRKKSYDVELVCVPFSMGWKREHVIRATRKDWNKSPSDVYYFAPDGSKLRSMPDIGTYLSKHPDIQLTLKNFTFAKELISREPGEIQRDAKRKEVATKTPLKLPE